MKLPNAAHALVEMEKITEYLLSTANPRGRSKAIFFLRFGFSADSWEDFAEALKLQASVHDVGRVADVAQGLRYQVDGAIETPDGRNPQIRTVWQIDLESDYPRFITAHPLRRRGDVPRTP